MERPLVRSRSDQHKTKIGVTGVNKKLLRLITVTAAVLISFVVSQFHIQAASPLPSNSAYYYLTGHFSVQLKSVLNEKTASGNRLGVVVRMYNGGQQASRIPDYTLKVTTEHGVTYKLNPSLDNAVILEPKGKTELSYMTVVDREMVSQLSTISWVDVNETVYPKKETLKLKLPITSMEWQGGNAVISDPNANIAWGDTFEIPGKLDRLVYTPTELIKQYTEAGPSSLLILEVQNNHQVTKWVPDFLIQGVANQHVYTGKRLENQATAILPGEKAYLHYTIPHGNEAGLESLLVLEPEQFTDVNGTTEYSIGKLRITLPTPGAVNINSLGRYTWGKPITFNSLNQQIPANVEVSVSGLHLLEGDGYNVVVADFKLQNRNHEAVPLPSFGTKLISSDGTSYMGTRHGLANQTLIPNISYAVNYYFIVPVQEQGERIGLEILDKRAESPFAIPIAAFRAGVQKVDGSYEGIDFYPYNVSINQWQTRSQPSNTKSTTGSYLWTYLVKLDLTVTRTEGIVTDQSFTHLEVELVNREGQPMGSTIVPFTGEDKLSSGVQTILVETEKWQSGASLRIYRTVTTPFGTARELVKELVAR